MCSLMLGANHGLYQTGLGPDPVNWLNQMIQSGFKNNGANSKQDNVLISEFLSFYFLFFNFVLVFILVLHYFTETFLCSKMTSEKFCLTDLVTLVCAITSGHPMKKRSKPYILYIFLY